MAGCDAGPLAALASTDTGLRGQTVRGPVQPVCHVDQPCDDEPFSAGFTVRQGARAIGTFRSGDDGRFAVRLVPGTYTVVPDDDAPILNPEAQAQPVTVRRSGVTDVVLAFDTGIR